MPRSRPDIGPCWVCCRHTYWWCEVCRRYLCNVCRGGTKRGDYSAKKRQVCSRCTREAASPANDPSA